MSRRATSHDQTVCGVVESHGDEPTADVALEAADADPVRRTARHTFSLRLEDGTRVEVDASTAVLEGWPEEVSRGDWQKIGRHPWDRMFADVAPGPHVSTRLRIARVRAGESAVVTGEVTTNPDAIVGEGYRNVGRQTAGHDGGGPRPAGLRVRATRIAPARGDARPDAAAQPPAPRRWSGERLAWWAAFLGMGTLAGVFFVLLDGLPHVVRVRVPCAATALACLAFAFAAFVQAVALPNDQQPGHHGALIPSFVRGNGEPSVNGLRFGFWLVSFMIPVGVIVFTALAGAYDAATQLAAQGVSARNSKGHRADHLGAGTQMVLVPALLLLGAQWAVARRSGRLARQLLRSTSRQGDLADGAWVTLVGSVADLDGDGRPVVAYHGRVVTRGSKVPVTDSTGDLVARPFRVDTPLGPFEVRLDAGEWATTFANHETTRGTSGNQWVANVQRRFVPVGARVVMAGRMNVAKDGRMQLEATGHESLIFFAAAGRRSPRWILGWRWLVFQLGLVVSLSCAAASIAVLVLA